MAEETTEWCMGLPMVQRRELDAQERQVLQQRIARLPWRGLSLLVSLPLLAAAVYAIACAVSSSPTEMQIVISLGGITAYFVGLPPLLLAVRDIFQHRKVMRRELDNPGVKCYAGIFQPEATAKALLRGLRRPCFAPDKATGEWSVETLAASGRLWRVQGQPVKQWRYMPVLHLAPAPPIAAIAAQWLQPVQHEGQKLLQGQREMSPVEREELRRFARRLCLRCTLFALSATVSLYMLSVMRAAGDYPSGKIGQQSFSFLLLVTIGVDLQFIVVLQAVRRMYRDAQVGQLVIVRVKDAKEDGNSADVIEVLPLAKRQWTVAGRPAPWRIAHTAE